jgi:hypothetical protein
VHEEDVAVNLVGQDLPNPWVILFLVLVFVAVGAGVLLKQWWDKWRKGQLARLAEQLGFVFHSHACNHVPGFTRELELFRRGERYRAENVLTGVWRNTVVEVFDCVYDIERSGRRSRSCRRAVVALEWPEAYPRLMIGPDTRLGELLHPIGGSDIRFESDEFNRNFRVQCDDRKLAYDVVHARTMDLLLRARQSMPDLQVQLAHGRGFFFRERALQAELVRPLLDIAVDFLENIPDFVRKNYARS